MHDWLELSHLASHRVRAALSGRSGVADLGRRLERGEGGDMTMVVDRLAEDAVFEVLEESGLSMTAISEERGVVELGRGGPPYAVIDPIDGSLNAKRALPFYALSIAFAQGMSMDDVEFGYVLDLSSDEEWWAELGGGAWLEGRRLGPLEQLDELEIVGIETARPTLIGEHADGIKGLPSRRIRVLGSVALAMCFVAGTRMDGMVSLRAVRSVDVAASQLIVREAGGVVSYPEAQESPGLGLDERYRVAAAGPGGTGGLLHV